MTGTILVPLTAALPVPPVLVTLGIVLLAWYALSLEFKQLRDRRVMALVLAAGGALTLATPVYAVTIPCDGDYWWCLCVSLLICWP